MSYTAAHEAEEKGALWALSPEGVSLAARSCASHDFKPRFRSSGEEASASRQ